MRQPGPCVRALCEPVALFLSMIIDHDTQRLTLQCNTKRHLAVSRSHFTLHTALFTLRHPSQHKSHATFMQPVQCDLQPHVAEHHRGTNHRSKRPKPATASHRSCPSSPAAATLHEKTQCFALRHPPQHKSLFCYVSCYVCIVIAIPVTQMYLSATRKVASQLPLITLQNITNYYIRFFNTQLLSHMHTLQHCHTAYIINYYVTFLPFYITIHYLLTYIYYI